MSEVLIIQPYINDTANHVFFDIEGAAREALSAALKELTELDEDLRAKLENNQREHLVQEEQARFYDLASFVIREHDSCKLALSPLIFTTNTQKRVPYFIAEFFLRSTRLGSSLYELLDQHGVFDFINNLKRPDTVTFTRRRLGAVMASLCMSISGVVKAEDISLEAIRTWQDFFKDETGSRWNPSLWGPGADVHYQCLREVSLALSRATGNQDVALRARQLRSDSKNLQYWSDFDQGAPAHIQPWLNLFISWRKISPIHSNTYKQMFMHMARWLNQDYDPATILSVKEFMTTSVRTPSFTEYMLKRRDENGKLEGGPALIQYLSYAKRFSEFLAEEMGVTVHPLVTATDIQKVKNEISLNGSNSRSNEARSRALPRRFYLLTKDILLEGENGWPGKDASCKVKLPGSSKAVYCPVLPTLFLALFDLPLRVGQMKRLDSGEGDTNRFDGFNLTWSANTGPNANYWRDLREGFGEQGYACLFDGEKPITGFFINTNKTGNPYRIPWQNEGLHRMLYALRCWQEANLPSAGPIKPASYIDAVDEAEEGKLLDYPDIFPLFRLPVERRSMREGVPPNGRRTNEFWQRLMAEVERRWNAANPNECVQLVKRQRETGQAFGAHYNPHGMRVAGLTMMLHQKVPIEIISKLIAGHATVMMTLYYMKIDPGAVHAALSKALEVTNETEAALFMQELRSSDLAAAQLKSVCISHDGLSAAVEMEPRDKVLWSDTGIGFCPYDGERCGDGGKLRRKNKRPDGTFSDVHDPVEGGARNCILCRHFVSGPAWMMPLWLYGNKLLRQLADKSGRIGEVESRLEQLRLDNRSLTERSRKHTNQIDQHDIELNALKEEQELIGKGLWNTLYLIESCKEIDMRSVAVTGRDTSHALSGEKSVDFISFEVVPEFIPAAMITAAARVYPVLHDDKAEAARNRFIDAIIWHNGGQPLSLAPLSPAERMRGQDAMSNLLLERVKHQEFEALTTGALKLGDIGLDGDVTAVLSAAVGAPFQLGLERPHAALTKALK